MHTVIAFQEAGTGAAGQANIAAVPDPHVRTAGDYIYVGEMNNIIGVFAFGSTLLTGMRLESPSMRRLGNYEISPIQIAIEPAGDDAITLHPMSPLALEINEGLECIQRVSADASADRVACGVFLSDGPLAPVDGEIFHVRATATLAAATSGVWQNAEITFDDYLPVGRYALVGAEVVQADGTLFRFNPVGESHRPGGVCITAVGVKGAPAFRHGQLGVWCEFDQLTPPSIEILTSETATATAVVLFLDLIKVA